MTAVLSVSRMFQGSDQPWYLGRGRSRFHNLWLDLICFYLESRSWIPSFKLADPFLYHRKPFLTQFNGKFDANVINFLSRYSCFPNCHWFKYTSETFIQSSRYRICDSTPVASENPDFTHPVRVVDVPLLSQRLDVWWYLRAWDDLHFRVHFRGVWSSDLRHWLFYVAQPASVVIIWIPSSFWIIPLIHSRHGRTGGFMLPLWYIIEFMWRFDMEVYKQRGFAVGIYGTDFDVEAQGVVPTLYVAKLPQKNIKNNTGKFDL